MVFQTGSYSSAFLVEILGPAQQVCGARQRGGSQSCPQVAETRKEPPVETQKSVHRCLPARVEGAHDQGAPPPQVRGFGKGLAGGGLVTNRGQNTAKIDPRNCASPSPPPFFAHPFFPFLPCPPHPFPRQFSSQKSPLSGTSDPLFLTEKRQPLGAGFVDDS